MIVERQVAAEDWARKAGIPREDVAWFNGGRALFRISTGVALAELEPGTDPPRFRPITRAPVAE